jgi:hypothetical protein
MPAARPAAAAEPADRGAGPEAPAATPGIGAPPAAPPCDAWPAAADEAESPPMAADGARLLLDCRFSRLGRVEIEARINRRRQHTDLTVRSEAPLAPAVRQAIREAAAAGLAAADARFALRVTQWREPDGTTATGG